MSLRRLLPLIVAPLLCAAAPQAIPASSPAETDPCAKIAGKTYMDSADALACYKSFPFDESLRQNVLTNVARVFDFFTFENYYLDSPAPFQDSTVDIQATITSLNTAKFETDYDFNKAVYDFINQLNDGHTRYIPNCYTVFQNVNPTPIIDLEINGVQGIHIAPDVVAIVDEIGYWFKEYFESIEFDWQRLAGARLVEVEGMDPYAYVNHIATTVSGNHLDHGIRVNSVYTSYRVSGIGFTQRMGDFAQSLDITRTHLKVKLVLANSTEVEEVDIPFAAYYTGRNFDNRASYWTNNCLAREDTNGVDLNTMTNQTNITVTRSISPLDFRKEPRADIIDLSFINPIPLPQAFLPDGVPMPGTSDIIKPYLLPDNETGVIFIGSFVPWDFTGFQQDIVTGITALKTAGATKLLIDLTNNEGGYVCLGQFLHNYLVGSQLDYPGFESTQRAGPLARKIVAAHVALGPEAFQTFFNPTQWAFLNGTRMPMSYNYDDPVIERELNGQADLTSQRFHDTCAFAQPIPDVPPFELSKIAIGEQKIASKDIAILVSNGACSSTCAMFSTAMNERYGTKIAVFGGPKDKDMEFKSMAGNQVLEWRDLDTEIKSVGLKNDALAPPDFLVNANFRHNWRTAYSWINKSEPIAYLSSRPTFRFPYTVDTYTNPQNLWTFAASKLFD
ncbi:hypothetical protein NLJ89_g7141 [Agrocybe chaxingu]|uniref:Tail specific protease domain-containing protein n=1 Tax=Agrocybe chaxingu TaxID=84603 RepID=A0A9W8JZN0_9AGAR|nr:hypothetical protein NLJ89_g7141 [Agrocybe chaxingu]